MVNIITIEDYEHSDVKMMFGKMNVQMKLNKPCL